MPSLHTLVILGGVERTSIKSLVLKKSTTSHYGPSELVIPKGIIHVTWMDQQFVHSLGKTSEMSKMTFKNCALSASSLYDSVYRFPNLRTIKLDGCTLFDIYNKRSFNEIGIQIIET